MSNDKLIMKNEIQESQTTLNQIYSQLESVTTNKDAWFRLHFALGFTRVMLDKLHRVLTSSEREANQRNASSLVTHKKQFRIDWESFFCSLDVITNITYHFTTDQNTGFVTSEKISNVNRIDMAETMVRNLLKAIYHLQSSEYQFEFEKWLVDLLVCWKKV